MRLEVHWKLNISPSWILVDSNQFLSCPMPMLKMAKEREAWHAAVHGLAKSQT